MRNLMLTGRPHPETQTESKVSAEQVAAMLDLWATLGSDGLRAEAYGFQPLFEANARFVVSLARQYNGRGTSLEALVTAAHRALVNLLNHYVGQVDKLDKVLTITLRDAIIAVIQP